MGLETLVLPEHWKMRPDTFDLPMWDAVIVHNEYGIEGQYSATDVCVDVGAHIGCFSWLAVERGFGRIFAYEVDANNFGLLVNNTAPLAGVEVRHRAVWRSDRREPVHLRQCPEPINTGGHTLVDSLEDSLVTIEDPISFDDVVTEAAEAAVSGRVKLVKMDCEGSEFPILYTATKLDLIDTIVGEYHERDKPPAHVADCGPFAMGALARHLHGAGFNVVHNERHWTGLGFFRADR